MADKITLDLKYAQDLVDFWSSKYEAIKAELSAAEEKANAHADVETKLKEAQDALAEETAKRIAAEDDAKAKAAQATQDKDYYRDRMLSQEKESKDLIARLGKAEQERTALTHQVTHLYSQASVLAAEADQSRKARIAELFPPVHYIEDSFVSQMLHISDPARFIANLPERYRTTERLYFLPRPPSCMPLRVPSCGKPGYWFYPLWVPTADNPEFELIVEGQPSLWTYLGRYTTAPLSGGDMRLSEWMVLDEQTKLTHAARVANQSLAVGQKASYATEIDVKRRYELGEWSVPCYSLRCVGFNRALYELMHATVAARVDGTSTVASTPAPATPLTPLSL